MKNIKLFFVVLTVMLNLQLVWGQDSDLTAFSLSGKNQKTIAVNQTFTGTSQLFQFDGTIPNIYGMAIKADVSFDDEKSLVRIILTDQLNNEYLLYETYPLLETNTAFSIDNLGEETALLNAVKPQSLRIEVTGATVVVKSITYSEDIDSGLDIKKLKKDKKNLQNASKIARLNKSIKSKGLAWVAGNTQVSELTYAERKKLYGQGTFPAGLEYYVGGIVQDGDAVTLKSATASMMVDKWDWRNRHGKDWMTSIKDQGACGSCWAFAAIGATEAQVNLYYNQPLNVDLSEQMLLSCAGAGTCSGGFPSLALDYVKNNGVIDEAAFPYAATELPCTNQSSGATDQFKIGGRVNFGSTDYPVSEDNLKKMIIKYGPLSSGLLDWAHAMPLVGWQVVKEGDTFYYRDLNKERYWYTVPAGSPLIGETVWIFKNSWGVWGDDGYIYVQTNVTNFGWTHALLDPIQSLKQNYTVQYVDNDHDGYYWWGLGPKPANCPGPDQPDGDDSDASLGPLDEYGNCIVLGTTPVVNFSADKTSVPETDSVVFTDLSTNNPSSWTWTFNGGTPATSTLKNPVVTYNTAGVYPVTLKVGYNSGEYTLTKTNYITVSAPLPPVVDFLADNTTIDVGEQINIVDESTNNPTSWLWSFPGGNPSSSTLKNPSVSYSAEGQYSVTLTATNDGGSGVETKIGYITVNQLPASYCNSDGNAMKEWITGVSLNGNNFTSASSGKTGYEDFTAKVFNVDANKTYPMTLTPKYSGKVNPSYWGVWIDFNHDSDFDDPGEQVLAVNNVTTTVSKSITIPSTALDGPTRLRVSMKRSAPPLPCELFAYGEVEDYTVNISGAASEDLSNKSATTWNTSATKPLGFKLFPNPVSQTLNLEVEEVFDEDEYSIFNISGVLMAEKRLDSNSTQVDVSRFPAGIYLVKIRNGSKFFQEKFTKYR